jgi:HK97 family phage major capsid protein
MENELSTHLRGDGKADAPISYPGGLLMGLEGIKEDDSTAKAIASAQKELVEKIKGVQEDLRKELKTDMDAMQKEKIDKINTAMDVITAQAKANNDKLTKFESDMAQKIASLSGRAALVGSKELAEKIRTTGGNLVAEFMRTGRVHQGMKEEFEALYGQSGQKATQFLIGSNTFAIPAELDAEIQQTLTKNSDILNVVGTVTTTTKDYRKLINRRGTGLGKAGETTTRALQNVPVVSEVELSYGELYSRFQISSHALDDSGFDVASEFLKSTGVDMAESIDTDVLSGSGVNTIKGYNAYSIVDTLTWGSILRVPSAGALDYDFLMRAIHAPRRTYRRNASFFIGKEALRDFRGLEDTNGNLVFMPSFNEGRFEEQLLGYKVFESEDFDPPTTDGARLAYFGDHSRAYLLHFLRGLRMIRDDVTTKGFVEYYVWRRWGGGLADSNAVVCLQKTASAS